MKIKELLEAMPAKITRVVPNVSAEIDNGDGTKTTIDLKKNPTALQKDSTGKVKLQTKPKPGTKPDPAKMIKPGMQVDTDDETK